MGSTLTQRKHAGGSIDETSTRPIDETSTDLSGFDFRDIRYSVRQTDGPIDYSNPAEFPIAAQRTADRRGCGEYILGMLELDGTSIRIRAVSCQPAWNFDAAEPLGINFELFYRWRSRQAVHQWKRDHFPGEPWIVINLGRLAVAD